MFFLQIIKAGTPLFWRDKSKLHALGLKGLEIKFILVEAVSSVKIMTFGAVIFDFSLFFNRLNLLHDRSLSKNNAEERM